eukprot:Colp12_sorted_trinity150504_noHs@4615
MDLDKDATVVFTNDFDHDHDQQSDVIHTSDHEEHLNGVDTGSSSVEHTTIQPGDIIQSSKDQLSILPQHYTTVQPLSSQPVAVIQPNTQATLILQTTTLQPQQQTFTLAQTTPVSRHFLTLNPAHIPSVVPNGSDVRAQLVTISRPDQTSVAHLQTTNTVIASSTPQQLTLSTYVPQVSQTSESSSLSQSPLQINLLERTLDAQPPSSVKEMLALTNLSQYEAKFEDQGADDLTQLLALPAEDVSQVLQNVGMLSKPLHLKRFETAWNHLRLKLGLPISILGCTTPSMTRDLLQLRKTLETPSPLLGFKNIIEACNKASEQIASSARIYKKEPLTPWQDCVNRSAILLCMEDPELVHDRDRLVKQARLHAAEKYNFAKGKSRSQLLTAHSEDGPVTKRARLTKSDERRQSIDSLRADIEAKKALLTNRDRHRMSSIQVHDYQTAHALETEMQGVLEEIKFLEKTLQALLKRQKKSEWYFQRKNRGEFTITPETGSDSALEVAEEGRALLVYEHESRFRCHPPIEMFPGAWRSTFEALSLGLYIVGRRAFCTIRHRNVGRKCDCAGMLAIAGEIQDNGFAMMAPSYKLAFPDHTYSAEKAKNRVLQMPLVALIVGRKVKQYMLLPLRGDVDYSLLHAMLQARFPEDPRSGAGGGDGSVTVTKEELEGLILRASATSAEQHVVDPEEA